MSQLFTFNDGREVAYSTESERILLEKADRVLVIINDRKDRRMSPRHIKDQDRDELVNLARAIGLPVNAIRAGSLKVVGNTAEVEVFEMGEEGRICLRGGEARTHKRVYTLPAAKYWEDE